MYIRYFTHPFPEGGSAFVFPADQIYMRILTGTLDATATVPLGFLPPNTTLAPARPTRSSGPNQPFGLSFLGTAFSEFRLVSLAFGYEQATHTRLEVLAFPEAIPKTQLADIVAAK